MSDEYKGPHREVMMDKTGMPEVRFLRTDTEIGGVNIYDRLVDDSTALNNLRINDNVTNTATAAGSKSVAVGELSSAAGAQSISMGVSSSTDLSATRSVNIGYSMESDAAGQVNLGQSKTNSTPNSFLVAPGGTEHIKTHQTNTGGFHFRNKLAILGATGDLALLPSTVLGGQIMCIGATGGTILLPTEAALEATLDLAESVYDGLTFDCWVYSASDDRQFTSPVGGPTIVGSTIVPAGTVANLRFFRSVFNWTVMIQIESFAGTTTTGDVNDVRLEGNSTNTAAAGGTTSVAIGRNAVTGAGANYSVAVGPGAAVDASCVEAVAVGNAAGAAGSNGTAVGASSDASANGAAVGHGATAGLSGTSLGFSATAAANAVAIGSDSVTGTAGIGIGYQSGVLGAGTSAIHIGVASAASGGGSVAVGPNTTSNADYAVAVGDTASAVLQGTAVGRSATASGVGATSVGANSDATQLYATAVGYAAQATSIQATAVGISAQATEANATAVGYAAIASAQDAVQLGAGTNSTADTLQYQTHQIHDGAAGVSGGSLVYKTAAGAYKRADAQKNLSIASDVVYAGTNASQPFTVFQDGDTGFVRNTAPFESGTVAAGIGPQITFMYRDGVNFVQGSPQQNKDIGSYDNNWGSNCFWRFANVKTSNNDRVIIPLVKVAKNCYIHYELTITAMRITSGSDVTGSAFTNDPGLVGGRSWTAFGAARMLAGVPQSAGVQFPGASSVSETLTHSSRSSSSTVSPGFALAKQAPVYSPLNRLPNTVDIAYTPSTTLNSGSDVIYADDSTGIDSIKMTFSSFGDYELKGVGWTLSAAEPDYGIFCLLVSGKANHTTDWRVTMRATVVPFYNPASP